MSEFNALDPERSLSASDLFVPKAALSGPQAHLFSGRQDLVRKSYRALSIPGAALIVHGNRGVGKSSLGWQLFELANSASPLRQKYDLGEVARPAICLWYECEARAKSFSNVLLDLLLPGKDWKQKTLFDQFPDVIDENVRNRAEKLKRGSSWEEIEKLIQSEETTSEIRSELVRYLASASSEADQDPIDFFLRHLNRAKIVAGQRDIFIFLDEFDRLEDKSGVGDFIKHCGNAQVVIIGVAETEQELIDEHKSVERKLLGSVFDVPPLDVDEISGIFSRAEEIVEHNKNYKKIEFTKNFVNKAFSDSGGYPGIAQFIGHASVVGAKVLERAQSSVARVGAKDYEHVISAIVQPEQYGETGAFARRIKDAVGKSSKRARILEVFSDFPDQWIEISDVRKKLKTDEKSDLVGNINKLMKSGILSKSKVQQDAYKFDSSTVRLLVRLAVHAGAKITTSP